MMKYLLSVFLIFLSFSTTAGFYPEDKRALSSQELSGATEKEIRLLTEHFIQFFSPSVSVAGGELSYYLDWGNTRVNAVTGRYGKEWRITILGGLARHKLMTKDGYVLTLCHELGHHLGGAPLDPKFPWAASSEGQADYFAGLKCLKRYWQNEENQRAVASLQIPPHLMKACAKTSQEFLCQRIGMAGLSTTSVWASRSLPVKLPKFETPDPSVVSNTNITHPLPQCRLDTYFKAALCGAPVSEDFDSMDERTGACLKPNLGSRPVCWYYSH